MLRKTLQLLVIASALTGGIALGCIAQTAPGAAAPTSPAPAAAKPITNTWSAVAPPQTVPSVQSLAAQAPSAGGAAAKPKPTSPPQQNATPVQPLAVAAPSAGTPPASSDSQSDSTAAIEPKKGDWKFEGMSGYVDKQAAQRGFQIYSQVCSACHSMNLVAYRDLSKLGFSVAEIKAVASQKQVPDFNDNGEAIQRPGKPSDHFVPPFPNEDASRAANNGSYPPDLSLIIKAREHGPDYVYSILTSFGTAPANETPVANKYYNPYFEGHWISMPQPLHDGAVTYQDGTNASIDQMARDVITFLQWAAEPEMEQRHEMGIKVLIFLCVMTVLFYIAKKRVWKNIKH